MALQFELGMRRDVGRKRVDVGHEVAADAVHVDEVEDAGLLLDESLDAPVGEVGIDVAGEAHRLVGNGERGEDLVVEPIFAGEQARHLGKEVSALGALDHPVVVGAGERDDLGHAKAGEGVRVGELVLGGIANRAGGEDQALPDHQARHGLRGAEHPRIGERDVGVGEVFGGELAAVGLADEVVVRREEGGELERLGALDARHDERTAAVSARDVRRESEVDVLRKEPVRRAVEFDVDPTHRRHRLECLDERPGEQVSERELAAGQF